MPERNIALLTAVRDLIDTTPSAHDQAQWVVIPDSAVTFEPDSKYATVSCASACCVAGHAAMLSGDKALVHTSDRREYKNSIVYSVARVQDANGKTQFIEDRAQELLGLTSEEANYLFLPDWKREYVLEMLNTLIAGGELDMDNYNDDYDDEDYFDGDDD